MERGPEQSTKKSASNAMYLTHGYLDPSIGLGGEYSATTDGFALGITMLVALTGRSPLNIIKACEEAVEEDFEDIDAAQLVDAAAGWPVAVAVALKDLVQTSRTGLCYHKERKRLAISEALATLTG